MTFKQLEQQMNRIPEIDKKNALPTILMLSHKPAEMLPILADATQDPNEAEQLINLSSQS